MAELVPHPIARLAHRMLHELRVHDSVFGLPRARFFAGLPGRDLGVHFHGRPAATPFGPAAGPHTQMAQNIVLSWLAGGRILELKTVQVMDRLEIPRPCIDMATVGFNVEWSQELRLEESLEEYVKAAMLIEILKASGLLELPAHLTDTIFDMSVGYDLAGIQSPAVGAFLDGMSDASAVIDRLRSELPAELGSLRDLDFPTRLSETLTLSTFHGCPPDEIERIVDWLLRTRGIDCVVKLNPTLLGAGEGRRILHEVLGYTDLIVPDNAFAEDTSWAQMVDFTGRLASTAASLGRGFGLKLTNTLIVENHRDFFPSAEARMYLSGAPLHVLAMELVRRVRATFGDSIPLSFSAGVDRKNFADAVALGLTPVTACSDLLQPGGYGRVSAWFAHLGERMAAVGAADIPTWTLLAHGCAEAALEAVPEAAHVACRAALASGGDLRVAAGASFEAWVSAARCLNTEHLLPQLMADPRYAAEKNQRPPKKVKSTLVLLDCLSCDKCLPVCPNEANFTFVLPPGPLPRLTVWQEGGAWFHKPEPPLAIEKGHQIGNFVDFCNDCGNCDVFCPELGGPYKLKARFHSSLERFQEETDRDAFFLDSESAWLRQEGVEIRVTREGDRLRCSGPGWDLHFDPADPLPSLEGRADAPVDLGLMTLVDMVRAAALAQDTPSWLAQPPSLEMQR